jgi:probable rRNA maturation factor
LLGDVVLCPAVAVRRAQEEGRSPNREVLELVVHGVLHLIGYDDRSDAGRQAMLARQALILQQMGA